MARLGLWLLICASVSFALEEIPQLNAKALDLHPFHYNMMVNTSADDPELDNYLWKGVKNEGAEPTKTGGKVITYSLQSKLEKRARRYGPLIKTPCLFCGQKKREVSGVNIGQFTPEAMVSKMKFGATIGSCIFYGQRANKYQNPKGNPQSSLSRVTTDYACAKVLTGQWLRTIWQLWPNDKGSERDSCETGQNYYCLDYFNPRCCWLNPLLGKDPKKYKDNGMAYFKAMSRAMAMTCSDEVYVMVDNKKMLLKQYEWAKGTPSIWLNDELPELQKRYNQGLIKKLTVVRYGDYREFDRTGYVFRNEPEPSDASENDAGAPDADPNAKHRREVEDVDENEEEIAAMAVRIAKAIKAKEAELLLTGQLEKVKSEAYNLQKRGICPSGADEETPGMDYFG
ncbi:hypothetical protein FB567DRAFT_585610 [Paraphoma chrysanthemicola]|uniref:Uncharacterized protein n=1 Tax=Paraphoma chrysanthemicola TaxID=798071 RepID=A0A8K0QR56_9PLEO|nr:hypothetical protein FB567DRAFT_585610 [Paraphoma chrysanthemicola]